MNLHGIVSGAIGTINPFIAATVKVSTGSVTNPDGSRTPAYDTITIQAQVQALQYTDIVQLDGLNIQGVRRKIYLTGDVEGLIRVNKKGGDIIVLPPDAAYTAGSQWLVAMVLEHWPDWVCVAVVLQNDPDA